MMGPRQVDRAALFYEFSLERHVPATHLLRSIDCFVDLSDVRNHLAPFYSSTGRPSIDPELLVRMLLVGYCYGIRSERRLCEEVHLNLAYRWFCRLGLDGEVPDHSTFSKNRHGRFRDCNLLRKLFETVVRRCMAEGLVEGAAFAVDASLIAAMPTSSVLLPGLMRLTGRRSPRRADPSGNISTPWMRLLGARRARRYRSSSPGRIRPHNGPVLTKGMPFLPTPTTTRST